MPKFKMAVLDVTHQKGQLKARPNSPVPMEGVFPVETMCHICHAYVALQTHQKNRTECWQTELQTLKIISPARLEMNHATREIASAHDLSTP